MSDKLKKYEALFILDAAIQEEAVKEIIDRIQKDIEHAGGHVETVQKMGQRPLARDMKQRSAGYYANFIFSVPPKAIHGLDAKFHLETDLLRWHMTDFVPEPVRKKRTQPATALSGE
jgi:small subunit ribosomal protein S6